MDVAGRDAGSAHRPAEHVLERRVLRQHLPLLVREDQFRRRRGDRLSQVADTVIGSNLRSGHLLERKKNMIAVTGATGKLGRLVIAELLTKVPAREIVALARSPEKAKDLGVTVREADYDKPETLNAALAGVDKVLLISASEPGKRVPQHTAVINAAKKAGVKLLAYTGILHGDESKIGLASEHVATEKLIRESGIPYVFLRNSWYIENYTENLGSALEHGAIVGSTQNGKVGAATRKDYAQAAASVLMSSDQENKTYELAGTPFTLSELAAEVAKQSGKPVVYSDVPHAKHLEILLGAHLPKPIAEMLVDADAGIARGDLLDARGDLARLIGRAPTPLAQAVSAALRESAGTGRVR
jgi:NAD(P)H dehydrogenase (quinone)